MGFSKPFKLPSCDLLNWDENAVIAEIFKHFTIILWIFERKIWINGSESFLETQAKIRFMQRQHNVHPLLPRDELTDKKPCTLSSKTTSSERRKLSHSRLHRQKTDTWPAIVYVPRRLQMHSVGAAAPCGKTERNSFVNLIWSFKKFSVGCFSTNSTLQLLLLLLYTDRPYIFAITRAVRLLASSYKLQLQQPVAGKTHRKYWHV